MAPPRPASPQYLHIYSPGGTCSGMLAIEDISNKLIFDLLTLKVVSKSRVTWATSVPVLVFLGLSVLESSPMYATDRQTLSLRAPRQHLFNGHFPRQPGQTGTRMSPFWILLERGMTDVVATTGAKRRAKLQWNCHCQ